MTWTSSGASFEVETVTVTKAKNVMATQPGAKTVMATADWTARLPDTSTVAKNAKQIMVRAKNIAQCGYENMNRLAYMRGAEVGRKTSLADFGLIIGRISAFAAATVIPPREIENAIKRR